ncbi:GNAT family N-acetyltransferase [Viridibacillus sp. NPDC096237]|uniref:GNAT family N-acetyltransferase n=1 Tax=Viridibacillus sp. NPDC096237 TaxID=3390721 RepID=UPI003D028810
MQIVIEAERLKLAVFEETFVEDMKYFWGDSEVMSQCDGATSHEKLPHIAKVYADCYRTHQLSVFAVIEKETNEVIGAAGFNITDSIEEIELIYHFKKSAWGKGFASEASQACLELANNHPLVNRVCASADPTNKASLKILEKLGLVFKEMRFFDDVQQEEPYYEITINRNKP